MINLDADGLPCIPCQVGLDCAAHPEVRQERAKDRQAAEAYWRVHGHPDGCGGRANNPFYGGGRCFD